jgi:hypothetical protein
MYKKNQRKQDFTPIKLRSLHNGTEYITYRGWDSRFTDGVEFIQCAYPHHPLDQHSKTRFGGRFWVRKDSVKRV